MAYQACVILSLPVYVHQEVVFTASQDQSIRVWGVQKTAPCAHVLRIHDGPVTGLSLHATGDYILSCSSDAVRFEFFF